MPRIYEGLTDILMTLDGDLYVGPDGDLALINGFEWLAGEINKIVRTINPEWAFHPNLGASLELFVGDVNSRATAIQIQRSIKEAISRSGLVEAEVIDVRVVPVDLYSVYISISIHTPQTVTTLSKVIFDFKNGVSQKVPERIAPAVVIPGTAPEDPHHRPAKFNKYTSRNPRG